MHTAPRCLPSFVLRRTAPSPEPFEGNLLSTERGRCRRRPPLACPACQQDCAQGGSHLHPPHTLIARSGTCSSVQSGTPTMVTPISSTMRTSTLSLSEISLRSANSMLAPRCLRGWRRCRRCLLNSSRRRKIFALIVSTVTPIRPGEMLFM